jgi:hypothetical protein
MCLTVLTYICCCRALLDLAHLLELPGQQGTTPGSSSSSSNSSAAWGGLWQYAGPHLQLASLPPGTVVQAGGGDPPAALWLLQGELVMCVSILPVAEHLPSPSDWLAAPS